GPGDADVIHVRAEHDVLILERGIAALENADDVGCGVLLGGLDPRVDVKLRPAHWLHGECRGGLRGRIVTAQRGQHRPHRTRANHQREWSTHDSTGIAHLWAG